ncbi:hypothetical protein FRB90_012703 [Tulasnella sp. 427]|nr:hypothetical protein FRB90_012703 [Tulasnella sp. 427]
MLASFLLVAFAALAANAHSVMQQVHIDGKAQGALKGIRVPKSNSPVTIAQLNGNDVICNAVRTPLPSDVLAVKGGSKVGLEWHRTIGKLSSDVISKSHRAPIQVYLAKVDSAKKADVSGLKWFKVAEQGYKASTDTWATDDLIKNKGIFEFTMPSCIEAGEYIMRTDLIALHNADKPSGAQLYIGCSQINVSGTSGSANPSTVSFPGAYKATDPGIKFNVYKDFSSYTIPGPQTFSCSGNSAGSNADAAATTTTKASTKTTTKASTKTKSTESATAKAQSFVKTDSKCRAKRGHA